MTSKKKTWRTHPSHKDFEVSMCVDSQQVKDQEMHCYLAKVKTQVSEPNVENRIDKQVGDLRKKIKDR